MSTQVQFRRGTAAENDAFTGANAEITVDYTNNSLRVHDGVTAGGFATVNASAPIITGNITGNLVPAANATYSLGAPDKLWGNLYLAGNTTSGNFIGTLNGSGANVSSISATNISSGTLAQARLANTSVTLGSTALTLGATVTTVAGLSSVTSTTFVGDLTGAATTAGTVTTAAQPNITSVGTLTSVTVSGNVSGGNLTTGGALSVTGNADSGNINTTKVTATEVIGGGISLVGNTISSTDSTLTIDPATAGAPGLVVIAGNLSVQGTTTTYESTTVTINDLVFTVANNAATSAAANGGGIEVGPVGSPYATWLYDQPSSVWNTALGISATGNITAGNLSGTSIVGTLTTAAQTNITSVGTLGSLSVTGNITGGNLITAGLVSLSSITKTGSNGVGNIGATASTFDTVFAKATSAQYADVAEYYIADGEYPVGTVLVFGGDQEVTQSCHNHSTNIAGVVSANPAVIMNSGLDHNDRVLVALLGRVPCRVQGPLHKGDRLVAGSVPGVAVRLDPARYQPGCMIGKALEDCVGEKETVIEVVVGRL